METNDGAASSTISVEQQAQTLARMTLFEQQRRASAPRARRSVKHEAGTADAQARRRRDKLAALSPLAKAARRRRRPGGVRRAAREVRPLQHALDPPRALRPRPRGRGELAASAGRAALRRDAGPPRRSTRRRAEEPRDPRRRRRPRATREAHGVNARRLVNAHRLRQDPPSRLRHRRAGRPPTPVRAGLRRRRGPHNHRRRATRQRIAV